MSRVYVSAPIADRFWPKVLVDDGCWAWTGAKNKHGYGTFETVRLRARAVKYAHRVAWELTNGPIPPGMCACHHCDNPSCVRPGHLFLGSRADNLADMTAKGRRVAPPVRRGVANNNAKLTAGVVSEIRAAGERGARPADIAETFGICRSQVSHILARRVWK